MLVAYTVIVSGEPGPDARATSPRADIAESLRTAWLVDVVKVLTALGSAAVVLPLAAIAAGAARRPPPLGGARGAGRRDGADRRRRPRAQGRRSTGRGRPAAWSRLSGSSFPSGHAAYSTFYVWLAVTIVMRLRPGMARGAAVVAAGIALTALVGLSRVYLGVHYMSDVSAGWALGAAAFSFCAAVALVITALRQNGPALLPLRCRRSKMSTCCSAPPGWSAWSPSSA